MNIRVFIVVLFLCCLACKTDGQESETNEQNQEIVFNAEQWKTKDGKDYPYRNKMLNTILYNDSIRALNKDDILKLLGKPDQDNDTHLYYMITQKRLGFWPLHTKTMVIKFLENNTIDWIKIHE